MDSWTCPYCNRPTSAIAQRTIKQHGETIRYRKCAHCGRNFKTVERLWSESPRAQAIAALLDLNVPADRALNLVERATPGAVLRYVAALPTFLDDRSRRNDPVRSPSGFICWAIETREPIPAAVHGENNLVYQVEHEQVLHQGSTDDLWSQVLTDLEMQMTRATFDRWLRGTQQIERSNGHLTIGVRDQYAVEWCRSRLHQVVERTVSAMTGESIEIRFQVV